MRLFLAIELDDVARRAAARVAATLERRLGREAGVRWVDPAGFHATLHFFGEVADDRFPALDAALDPPLQAAPFEATLGRGGAFPSSGAPRVIWIGLASAGGELVQLHEEVEARVTAIGFEREARPLAAHVTLGRIHRIRPAQAAALRSALADVAAVLARVRVEHVTLFRSRLSPAGARYEPLRRIPLGGTRR
ncbi:MAG TPA: RNA 2',3'-cyclic phosphodiesterase [Vicinamibacterales bacterium]|nr:RNA 2',3'-cyclic phosphodiesterase [Vicinamibacterales bacterium]